jgi:tripartite-type tricarboxylate transporter receptor subunit TctC
MNIRNVFAPLALALAVAALATAPARAQEWPSKPVHVIVPAPAGLGTADPISRALAGELEKTFGQRFLVDNKPGANGNVGAAAAAKSPPDGYTFLFSWAGTLATNISLYKSMPFHPQRDFDPVVLIGAVPNILVVNNDLPVKTLEEFTAYVKTNPGKLNFGSTGSGSSMHLAGELYKKTTGTQMTHVPYNAPAQATGDLISGNIQVMFQLVTGIASQVKAGRVRAIAVMAKDRSPVLPEVPTFTELGMPLESETWFALLAPKGAPPAAIARLNAAVNKALADPAVRGKLQGMGLTPMGGTPERLAAHLESEIAKWAEVVKFSGARID